MKECQVEIVEKTVFNVNIIAESKEEAENIQTVDKFLHIFLAYN